MRPPLPFPPVARHPLSCEEPHHVVVIDLPLNGFGKEPEDAIAQVDKTIVAARRGNFLPDDFKFSDKHEASFESIFDL